MKKALLIGIDYINSEKLRLYGCINDANLIANMLMDVFDYEKKNITMIRDDTENTELVPNKKNLLKSFRKIFDDSKDCEEIWIHYSGHGTYRTDDDNDEKDFQDEVIVPIDYKREGIISDDMLLQLVNKSKCRTIITFDCCNSGSLWDLPYRFEYKNNRFQRFYENKNELLNKEIFMLSSCRDYQLSIDGWDKERRISLGGMTTALLDCLRFNRYNVSIFKLFRDMCIYTEGKNREQITTLSSSAPFPKLKLMRPINMKKNDEIWDLNKEILESLLR
jgi:hypothetical protein